jgi:PAS fold
MQATLDHTTQGLMVFARELRLAAWNRSLCDMRDMPNDSV